MTRGGLTISSLSEASRPLVSVIIPSFNQGRFIAATLRSCLAQGYRPLEVLVLDGGSADDTVKTLRSCAAPELRWWSEPDQGVVDAVNCGLERARGEILSIQSSDDLFLPGAVSAAVEALLGERQLGLVYGDVELIDAEGRVTGADRQGPFDLNAYLGRLQYIPQPGAFFTRAALQAAGRWRREVSYAADADFWLRIVTKLPAKKLDRLVGQYRYHPEQRDTQHGRIARDWGQTVRDLLESGVLEASSRRYARMGIWLALHRYAAREDWGSRTKAMYGALIANPLAVFDPRFPRRDLIPGREPIWTLLSRVKRGLGFKPRTK